MEALLVGIGLAAVAAAILDVVWTAAAAGSGAGPLSGRLSAALWRLALSIGRRPSGPRHRFLTVAGIGLAVAIVVMWATAAWAGWWLVFSATDGAVVDAASGAPAGLVERVQFAGASLFTLGSDELTAGSGVWQFAVIGATATGVVFVTLAISYLVPVASALAEGRQLGAYISSLGGHPRGHAAAGLGRRKREGTRAALRGPDTDGPRPGRAPPHLSGPPVLPQWPGAHVDPPGPRGARRRGHAPALGRGA